jgi:ankyrin repeat protein
MRFFSKKPNHLSQKQQRRLHDRLFDAAEGGHTEIVQALLAAGADAHARNDEVLRRAASKGHTEIVKLLLASGANVHADSDYALCLAVLNDNTETVTVLLEAGADVHAENDYALRWAASNGYTEMVKVLMAHIFAPESWRGKTRAEIEAHATALCDKINKAHNAWPDHLRKASSILLDCALCCWEQVRPPPPKIQISPFPAQPRAL